MRSIILALWLAGGAISAVNAAPWTGVLPPGTKCADDPAVHLAKPERRGQFRKLVDLPPAEAYLAVYHRGPDGCVIPVKVSDRYIAPGRRAPARLPRR